MYKIAMQSRSSNPASSDVPLTPAAAAPTTKVPETRLETPTFPNQSDEDEKTIIRTTPFPHRFDIEEIPKRPIFDPIEEEHDILKDKDFVNFAKMLFRESGSREQLMAKLSKANDTDSTVAVVTHRTSISSNTPSNSSESRHSASLPCNSSGTSDKTYSFVGSRSFSDVTPSCLQSSSSNSSEPTGTPASPNVNMQSTSRCSKPNMASLLNTGSSSFVVAKPIVTQSDVLAMSMTSGIPQRASVCTEPEEESEESVGEQHDQEIESSESSSDLVQKVPSKGKKNSKKYSPSQLSFFSFLAHHVILCNDPEGLSYKDKLNSILGRRCKTHNEDFIIWLEDSKLFLEAPMRVVSSLYI